MGGMCLWVPQPHLENGDKVILPPSALDRLSTLPPSFPSLSTD